MYERGGNLQDVLSTITPTEFKVRVEYIIAVQ
jgi:hypothetical protein